MSDINELASGQIVVFYSKNPDDNVMWKGKIVGTGIGYSIALQYNDLVSYHINTKKVHQELDDVKILSYFLLELDRSITTDAYRVRAFAKEWIEEGSFMILDEDQKVTLDIYDISSEDLAEIKNILRIRGCHVEEK